ncbi:hypothetical protein FCIRC_2269 [Fusarium circinatum]|uniref:Uncharacterized protein n=1 Tax=Fusarium circinatum TaxID=48490 RepID=A0A8H5UDM4_FUSCI|nr:hypothetical protein FCIRC_2269 [Fusarium circinatum]
MNPHQTSNDTSIRDLPPPSPKWPKCLAKDKQAIELYNVLVQQWNTWAKEDVAEKEKNWSDVASRLQTPPGIRPAAFGQCISQRAQGKGRGKRNGTGKGRATVCWGHCTVASSLFGRRKTNKERQGSRVLNQLQQWYPRSKIMDKPRYNEEGPSFPTIKRGDPIPVRGTVLQRNNQEQESDVHGETNTPQQSDTPHQHNTPQQSDTADQSNTAQ